MLPAGFPALVQSMELHLARRVLAVHILDAHPLIKKQATYVSDPEGRLLFPAIFRVTPSWDLTYASPYFQPLMTTKPFHDAW